MSAAAAVAAVGTVILAAGRGERLGGVAKAGLTLPEGRSFLAAVVATARAGGAGPLVVVVAAPFAAEVRALAAALPVDAVVENPAPERGMASSFAAGLDALAAFAPVRAALSWPVDHPRVAAATVTAITAAAATGAIVVPTVDGRRGHPTAFGADLFGDCRDVAAAGTSGGLRAVLTTHAARVRLVAVADPGIRADVDTPDEWAKI